MGCAASIGASDKYAPAISPSGLKIGGVGAAVPEPEAAALPSLEPESDLSATPPEPEVDLRAGWMEMEVVISRTEKEWQRRWCVARAGRVLLYLTEKEHVKNKPPQATLVGGLFGAHEPKSKLRAQLMSEGRRAAFVG